MADRHILKMAAQVLLGTAKDLWGLVFGGADRPHTNLRRCAAKFVW